VQIKILIGKVEEMLKIIGLDESGEFEANKNDTRFVGGYTALVKDKSVIPRLKREIENLFL